MVSHNTVSQLVDCSSGMHPRFSKFILRRVAQDKKDPLSDLLISEGVPYYEDGDKFYFEFPLAVPENSLCIKDIDPIYQLKVWKVYQHHWCDGNPSQSIYYNDSNFPQVQSWVWEHWDIIGGLSFFPHDDNIYPNNPYTAITEEKYRELLDNFPKQINYDRLCEFEHDDMTTSAKELSCSGGACEI